MRTTAKLVALGCAALVALAACAGGSDRLSARAYAREASAVCRGGNRAIDQIEVPRSTTPRVAARAMARIVGVQRSTVDELRELRPPERLTTSVSKWIALLDQGGDELEAMARLLRAGRAGEAFEYGAKATTLLGRAQQLAVPLGVTSCRGPQLVTV